jgi:ADP-ribosylglycohydrolase
MGRNSAEPSGTDVSPATGPTIRERFTGCLLAGAAGDALGAPIEFMRLGDIRARFGIGGLRDFVPAYGRLGAITDDTQMTLFTAEGMLRSYMRSVDRGICSAEAVTAYAYHRWLLTQGESSHCADFIEDWPGWLFGHKALHKRRAPGNTCLSSLRDAQSAEVLAANDSKGCGAVMRMAPVGLAGWRFDWDAPYVMELGAHLGHITHGHPTGYLAAGAFAVMIHAIVRGATLTDAAQVSLDCLAHHNGHNETSNAIQLACTLAKSEKSTDESIGQLGEGWIAEEALAIGLYCALVSASIEDGVILAANIDGDSDSTGSIAGNLLGALHGVTGIPSRWLETLELRDVIEEIAGDLHDCVSWEMDDSMAMELSEATRRLHQKYPPN